MKKIKTILATLSFSGIFSLVFIQKTLADLLPPGDKPSTPSRQNVSLGSKTFIDLIEPQYIIIGGSVLVLVIASFIVLFKMRKK